MKTTERGLTVARVRELLAYDPETGILTWKVSRSRIKAGAAAGTKTASGYLQLGIDRKLYHAHRIIWAMSYGEFPSAEIDHRDGDRTNNRLANLRCATRIQQLWNKAGDMRSVVGLKGVWPHHTGKYAAEIQVNGRKLRLGLHATPELAKAAYDRAARQFFGEFARA